MIVKTGANYQAEGGYIEASAKGLLYTLTDNDKSVKFGGSEEFGPLIVPVTIINDTGRSLAPTCLSTLGSIENVLGAPITNIVGVGETVTIKCIGIIGLHMRISYTGGVAELKCESEYMAVENSGSYSMFTLLKMPENGEPVTMRLYV